MNQESQQQKVIQTFNNFLSTPLDAQLQQHLSAKVSDRVVELFHHVAGTVPAYGDFLKAYHINIESISSFADFQQLPPITKQNYLQRYPIQKS